jgi:hypothetical protein
MPESPATNAVTYTTPMGAILLRVDPVLPSPFWNEPIAATLRVGTTCLQVKLGGNNEISSFRSGGFRGSSNGVRR